MMETGGRAGEARRLEGVAAGSGRQTTYHVEESNGSEAGETRWKLRGSREEECVV